MEYVVRDAIGSDDRLLEALRTLAELPDRRSILDRIPPLAMGLCAARGVRLVESGEGRPAGIVAACSARSTRPDGGNAGERPSAATSVDIAGASGRRKLALVVERDDGGVWTADELHALRVFAFVSSIVLERAETPPTAAGHRAASGDTARFRIDDLIGDAPAMQRARDAAVRVADSDLPIVLTGETGTGKEILAQAIHNLSSRASEPFVGVNVSAIPRELLESELFGYEAGAFTGASAHGRAGKFEAAGSGTVLLDEIGEMPLEMQAKLLRTLQERAVCRLGASRSWPVAARVIASTNQDLDQAVREGRFRVDLLHRLRGVQIELPPLRHRAGDLRLLVAHQLRVLAQRTGRRALHVTDLVMAELERYDWPGNVRELVNMLECEVRLLPAGKDVIDVVPAVIARSLHRGRELAGPMTLDGAEREACLRALEKTGGHIPRAACILGVAKATLYSKIRRYGIEPHRVAPPPRDPWRGRSS